MGWRCGGEVGGMEVGGRVEVGGGGRGWVEVGRWWGGALELRALL